MIQGKIMLYGGKIIGLTGWFLCFYWYDWKLWLIIFLCMWGNNAVRKAEEL